MQSIMACNKWSEHRNILGTLIMILEQYFAAIRMWAVLESKFRSVCLTWLSSEETDLIVNATFYFKRKIKLIDDL